MRPITYGVNILAERRGKIVSNYFRVDIFIEYIRLGGFEGDAWIRPPRTTVGKAYMAHGFSSKTPLFRLLDGKLWIYEPYILSHLHRVVALVVRPQKGKEETLVAEVSESVYRVFIAYSLGLSLHVLNPFTTFVSFKHPPISELSQKPEKVPSFFKTFLKQLTEVIREHYINSDLYYKPVREKTIVVNNAVTFIDVNHFDEEIKTRKSKWFDSLFFSACDAIERVIEKTKILV